MRYLRVLKAYGDVYQHSVAMMQEAGVNWVFDNRLNKTK